MCSLKWMNYSTKPCWDWWWRANWNQMSGNVLRFLIRMIKGPLEAVHVMWSCLQMAPFRGSCLRGHRAIEMFLPSLKPRKHPLQRIQTKGMQMLSASLPLDLSFDSLRDRSVHVLLVIAHFACLPSTAEQITWEQRWEQDRTVCAAATADSSDFRQGICYWHSQWDRSFIFSFSFI